MKDRSVTKSALATVVILAALVALSSPASAQELPDSSEFPAWQPDIPEPPFEAKEIVLEATERSTLDLIQEVAIFYSERSDDSLLAMVPVERLYRLQESGVRYNVVEYDPYDLPAYMPETESRSEESDEDPIPTGETRASITAYAGFSGDEADWYEGDYSINSSACGWNTVRLSPGLGWEGGAANWSYPIKSMHSCVDQVTYVRVSYYTEELAWLVKTAYAYFYNWLSGSWSVVKRLNNLWINHVEIHPSELRFFVHSTTGKVRWRLWEPWYGDLCVSYTELKFTYTEMPPECKVEGTGMFTVLSDLGETGTNSFTITHTGCAGTLSGSVTSSNPQFAASPSSYSLQTSQTATITVAFTPQICGWQESMISTGSSCPDFTAYGLCDGPTICNLSPTELVFPNTEIGDTNTLTYSISVSGCGRVWAEIIDNCEDFIVEPNPANIPAGQTGEFTVTFAPQTAGVKACTLRQLVSDCNDVVCQGTATRPSMQVGDLTFWADDIQQFKAQVYQLSGNVSINNLMYFSDNLFVDMSRGYPEVSGTGAITMEGIPGYGTLQLYDGDIAFKVQHSWIFDFFNHNSYYDFKLGGFPVHFQVIAFSAPDAIAADCVIDYPEFIGGPTSFNNLYIYQTSGVSIPGGILIADFTKNAIEFRDGFAGYNPSADLFSGGITVETPLVTMDGSLQFIYGGFEGIELCVTPGQPVPIGETGLSLEDGCGEVENWENNAPVAIVMTSDLTSAPTSKSVPSVSFDDVPVRIKYPLCFDGEGGMSIFGCCLGESGLHHRNRALTMNGCLNIDGMFIGDVATAVIDSRFCGGAFGHLETDSELPGWLSWLENTNMGYASAAVHDDCTRGAVWYDLAVPDFSPQIFNFGYALTYEALREINLHFGENYEAVSEVLRRTVGLTSAVTFVVPEAADRAVFVAYPKLASAEDFRLVNPTSDTLGSDHVPFIDFPAEGYALFIVNDPKSGQWEVLIPDGSRPLAEAYVPNHSPAIQLTEPSIPCDGNTIEWIAEDPDDDTEIYLYYDTDNRGFDGNPVNLTAVKAGDGSGRYEWDVTDVETGEYYMYACMSDPVNGPMRSYSHGTVLVEQPGLPPKPTNLIASAGESSVALSWDAVPGVTKYVIYYMKSPADKSDYHTVAVNDVTAWEISGLVPGYMYEFSVAAGNDDGHVGALSDPVIAQPLSTKGNNAPSFTSVDSPLAAVPDRLYQYTLAASDPDGDPVSFSLTEHPAGMSLVGDCINWIPDATQSGIAHVVCIADDRLGGVDSLAYSIHICNRNATTPNLRLNANLYRDNTDFAFVLLDWFNADGWTHDADSIQVEINSTSDLSGISLWCCETSAMSNTFCSYFGFTPGLSQTAPPLLHVESGDSVYARFTNSVTSETYTDRAVWYRLPTDCREIEMAVEPEIWQQSWIADPQTEHPPLVSISIDEEQLKGYGVAGVDFESIRLNHMVAPKPPISGGLVRDRADSLRLLFDGALAVYSIGESVPGESYEIIVSGLFNDGEPFCAETDVQIAGGTLLKTTVDELIPRLELAQNYPNPFNLSTEIEFSVKAYGHVSLEVFNMLGAKVRTLVDENLAGGLHHVMWDGKDDSGNEVGSGVYLYRLNASGSQISRKMMLIK